MTNSIQQQTSNGWVNTPHQVAMLTRPNPPTKEAIEKAKFVDKTYVWKQK